MMMTEPSEEARDTRDEPRDTTAPPGESGFGDEVPEEVRAVIDALKVERDEAVESRLRALADLANFQRRTARNEPRANRRGAVGVLRSVLTVLDQVELALGQDLEQVSARQLADGVTLARDELRGVLRTFGVERIGPRVGDPFDPVRHEAMLRRAQDGVSPNHVVEVLQVGWEDHEHVLRPAKVAIAPEEVAVEIPADET